MRASKGECTTHRGTCQLTRTALLQAMIPCTVPEVPSFINSCAPIVSHNLAVRGLTAAANALNTSIARRTVRIDQLIPLLVEPIMCNETGGKKDLQQKKMEAM